MRGTINDSEVYMDEDQLPAFSLSVDSLHDPTTIKGATSTTIRVVNTSESARVLGTEFIQQRRPSARPILQIGMGSVDYFRSEVVVTRQDRDVMECFAIGGNATWFEYAKTRKLRQMDFGHTPDVTAAYQQSTWTDVDSVVTFPLVDFGSLVGMTSSTDVAVTKLRPAFRPHKILKEAFKAGGFDLVARGGFAEDFRKLAVLDPAADIQSRATILQDNEVHNENNGEEYDYVETTPRYTEPAFIDVHGTGTTPPFVFHDNYMGANQYYQAVTPTVLRMSMRNMHMWGWSSQLEGSTLLFVLFEKTTGTPLHIYETPPLVGAMVTVNYVFPDVPMEVGDRVNIGVWNNLGLTGLDAMLRFGRRPAMGDPTSYIKVEPIYTPYAASLAMRVSSVLPDWTVMELLKGIVLDQCLVVTTSGTTIELWRDTDYYTRPEAGRVRDWQDRIDITVPPRLVRNDIPKKYLFRFKADEGDRSMNATRLLPEPGFANADVPTEGIRSEQEIELPFAATVMGYRRTNGPIRIPIMIDADATSGTDEYDREVRLLVMDGTLQTPTFKHGGSMTTGTPSCYFSSTGSKPLEVGFSNMTMHGDETSRGTMATLWRERIQRITAPRVVEVYLQLRDHEIRAFHHGVPTLVDYGSGPVWYYVQEIFQHQFGRGGSTKCVLVPMPGAAVRYPPMVNGPIVYPNTTPNTILGPFTWDDAFGLLHTQDGVTRIVVLNTIDIPAGSWPYGTLSWHWENGVVLAHGSDQYALVMMASPVGPGDVYFGTFSWSDTYGFLLTKNGITYQVDMLTL